MATHLNVNVDAGLRVKYRIAKIHVCCSDGKTYFIQQIGASGWTYDCDVHIGQIN